jgi:Putative transposase of IS4/5 family (DUF4096)
VHNGGGVDEQEGIQPTYEANPERCQNIVSSHFNGVAGVWAAQRSATQCGGLRDFSGVDSFVVAKTRRNDSMAWTEITRRKYQRDGLRYAGDNADQEWHVIEPHLPPPAHCGRTRETSLRDVVDGIFYIAQTGCQWRLPPKDFQP